MKLLLAAFCFLTTSFYTLQFQDINGVSHTMSQYQGKKILLVNIATESPNVGQLAKLQQLKQLYPDSLVIIGFPSNSFGHESKTDSAIKQFCQTQYGVTFLLASKQSITGSNMQPIYHWLATQTENGVANNPIGGDFQKFLINESGQLIGIFAPSVSPLSSQIKNAISGN